MKTVKILHAADLHLDSPFEALGDLKAAERRSEQRGLLAKLALLAGKENVDVMLLAGDLLDSDCAYLDTAEMIEQTLGRLKIPVVIAPGNHDYYSARSPYARLGQRPNIHIFTRSSIESVGLPRLGLRIWGAGFNGPSCPPLLEGFTAQAGDDINVMVIHGDMSSKSSQYNPISEASLARSGLDYAALGHTHSFSGLRRAGGTFYAWPGCTEGRGFDETGDKGVIIAEAGRGFCELKFESLCGRRYEILDVDVSDAPSPLEAVISALPASDTARDIYRIILSGECDGVPDITAVSRELEDRFFELDIRDKTVLRRGLWERAGEDTLRGLFLTRLRRKYDAATSEREKELIARAARYGLMALDNREEVTLR